MKVFLFLAAALSAYLICGVNPAIILSKAIYKQDIRTLGSHNAGFTNFKRVFGSRYAWFVFLLDVAKSLVPCIVFGFLFGHFYDMRQLGVAFTGFFGMLGHAYPVWYRFRGGKSFLVFVASIFMIDWRVGLVATGIFLFFLFVIQYMSLASISTAFTAPVALALFGCETYWTLVLLLLSSMLLVFRHKENIDRLIHKEEGKFSLFGKLKKKSAPVDSSSLPEPIDDGQKVPVAAAVGAPAAAEIPTDEQTATEIEPADTDSHE